MHKIGLYPLGVLVKFLLRNIPCPQKSVDGYQFIYIYTCNISEKTEEGICQNIIYIYVYMYMIVK